MQSSVAHTLTCSEDADSSVADRNWKIKKTGSEEGNSAEPHLLQLLSTFKSSCFGTRVAAPALYGIGYFTRGSIISASCYSILSSSLVTNHWIHIGTQLHNVVFLQAFGLLLTFFCFMADQNSRSEQDTAFQSSICCQCNTSCNG
jgi:hypothetical protein